MGIRVTLSSFSSAPLSVLAGSSLRSDLSLFSLLADSCLVSQCSVLVLMPRPRVGTGPEGVLGIVDGSLPWDIVKAPAKMRTRNCVRHRWWKPSLTPSSAPHPLGPPLTYGIAVTHKLSLVAGLWEQPMPESTHLSHTRRAFSLICFPHICVPSPPSLLGVSVSRPLKRLLSTCCPSDVKSSRLCTRPNPTPPTSPPLPLDRFHR